MQVVFRVDASLEIGAGHVMRCMTLADALRENGAVCRFVCRNHPGNLILFVRQRGYEVLPLPVASKSVKDDKLGSYAGWLGGSWEEDAAQTRTAIAASRVPEWLVVDHYAIDAQWEKAVRQSCRNLVVIDDLANRRHDADILLDQTLGRTPADYQDLVTDGCELRCGIENVLLRPEFEYLRTKSLDRRVSPGLKRILVNLGGVDKDNISHEILIALERCGLPPEVEVCVVLGETSPWIPEVQDLIRKLNTKVELNVAVSNMADLMAWCDLAIGAAGTAAWERCCLGVPTLMLVLADNQREVAARIVASGAAVLLQPGQNLKDELVRIVTEILSAPDRLLEMSKKAAALVTCSGAARLARKMSVVAK